MTFVMPMAVAAPMLWGERTELHPKRMVYALSLDLTAVLTGQHFTLEPRPAALRHLFDQAVLTMPDGPRCDLPEGQVLSGQGRIGTDDDPASSALSMQISASLGQAGPVLIECRGVVNFHGGPLVLQTRPARASRGAAGTAFLATRHETSSPTYRWLNRRQLWGVGRVALFEESQQRKLALTFDLYAAV